MAYASKAGRASLKGGAYGVCDRCGIWHNLANLNFQYDWAGTSLINKQMRVCPQCYDKPQEQLRAIVLPADPVPVSNPRVEPFLYDETTYRQISGANRVDPRTGLPIQAGAGRILTDDGLPGDERSVQSTGEPPGGLNSLPGTDQNAVTYRIVMGAENNGTGLIRLTLDTNNGMQTGQRIWVREVGGMPAANGDWIISVVGERQIDLNGSVFSGYYTHGGYAVNANVVPRGTTSIPRAWPDDGVAGPTGNDGLELEYSTSDFLMLENDIDYLVQE